MRAFQDANHPALGPALAALRARITFVASDPRHHFVAVHRGAGIFRGDKKVLLSRFSRCQKGVARLVDVQRARHQIRFRGEDVAVLADTRDLSGLLELAQHLVQSHANATFPAEGFSQLHLIERPIFRRTQEAQDLFAQLLIV